MTVLYELVPTKPQMDGAARMVLHESLVSGLKQEGLVPDDGALDAAFLDRWADGSANPSGGKANLARSMARFVDSFGGLLRPIREGQLAGGTFWDAVARL